MSFAADLTKNTAYGMVIPGSGAKVGSWAPVTMQTRMNKVTASVHGPVLDTNNVFDIIAVDAAAVAVGLAAEQLKVGDKTFSRPGEKAKMQFTLSFDSSVWTKDKVVKAPWNLVLKMANSPGSRKVDAAVDTWVRN